MGKHTPWMDVYRLGNFLSVVINSGYKIMGFITLIAGIAQLALCVGLIFMYFLPAFVGKDKKNAGAIFMFNLLLGWTVIGWVIALCWAMLKDV